MIALRHFWTGTRVPPSQYFDPWEWSRGYRRSRFAFSRMRQFRHRSHITRLNERPCPTCHGSDMTSDFREGFGCMTVHCDRCQKDYAA